MKQLCVARDEPSMCVCDFRLFPSHAWFSPICPSFIILNDQVIYWRAVIDPSGCVQRFVVSSHAATVSKHWPRTHTRAHLQWQKSQGIKFPRIQCIVRQCTLHTAQEHSIHQHITLNIDYFFLLHRHARIFNIKDIVGAQYQNVKSCGYGDGDCCRRWQIEAECMHRAWREIEFTYSSSSMRTILSARMQFYFAQLSTHIATAATTQSMRKFPKIPLHRRVIISHFKVFRSVFFSSSEGNRNSICTSMWCEYIRGECCDGFQCCGDVREMPNIVWCEKGLSTRQKHKSLEVKYAHSLLLLHGNKTLTYLKQCSTCRRPMTPQQIKNNYPELIQSLDERNIAFILYTIVNEQNLCLCQCAHNSID